MSTVHASATSKYFRKHKNTHKNNNRKYHSHSVSHKSNYLITSHVFEIILLYNYERIRVKTKSNVLCYYGHTFDLKSLWKDFAPNFETYYFMDWFPVPKHLYLFYSLGDCSLCKPPVFFFNSMYVYETNIIKEKDKMLNTVLPRKSASIFSNVSAKLLGLLVLYFFQKINKTTLRIFKA